MTWSLGMNRSSTHVDCFHAVNVNLGLVVTRSFLLTVLDCSRLYVPLVVVVSVSWCASTSRALTLQAVCTQAKCKFDVGNGDQVNLFGYAGDETGKTKVRSLRIGLDAGG